MSRNGVIATAFLTAFALACGKADQSQVAAVGNAESIESDPGELLPASDPDPADQIVWAEGDEGAPQIISVHLDPAAPESGRSIRALVDMARSGGLEQRLTYTWEIAGHRMARNNAAVQLPKLRKGDIVRVSVVASNNVGSSRIVTVEARIGNTPPRLLDLKLEENYSDEEGELWTARAWAEDPDGDEVKYIYTWYVNGKASTQTGGDTFAARSLKRGDRVYVSVVATDGEDESARTQSGELRVANSAPEITSQPPTSFAAGVYRYAVEAIDADGDRILRYELLKSPRGMSIDTLLGVIEWRPGEDQIGSHQIVVAVSDPAGSRSTQAFVIPIVVKDGANDVPPAQIE